uniref:PHD-type domain-containing protein n=1 Tax=Globisporangium ultimum (strain ATCC 200006 / CBS 805.95 / DAOM BR144) TaxID=431595 RepID=K3X4N5_GLOUD
MASADRRNSTRSARNNNIAADAVTSGKNRNHAIQAAEEEEVESESDGSDAPCCTQCAVANQRALVTCAACAAHFHLGCASPPLRRRPVLASAWRCGACSSRAEAESAAATRRSARNAAVAVVEQESATRKKRVNAGAGAVGTEEVSSDAEPPKKSRRRAAAAATVEEAPIAVEKVVLRSRRSAATTRTTVTTSKSTSVAKTVYKDEEQDLGDDLDLVPIAQTLRSPPGKSTAKAPARKGKLPRAAAASLSGVKVSAKTPRTQRVRAAASGKRQQRKSLKTAAGTDSDDDTNTADDDDNDSDFHSDDAASDDDDDDNVSDGDASDDEFVARGKKLPKLKSPAKKLPVKRSPGPKKSPAKARATRTPAATAAGESVAATTPDSTTNDVDSMDLAPQDDDEEEEEEEEVYTGPRYYVEYAANNRAKCKQCERKLVKDAIRIGVRVRHSMFGITTYYK